MVKQKPDNDLHSKTPSIWLIVFLSFVAFFLLCRDKINSAIKWWIK